MVILIILFSVSRTQLYFPAVTLSARDYQKPSKLFSKGFERSVYWNEYKTKCENKNATNEHRYFLESDFVGVNRLFVLVCSNQGTNSKRFKTWRYYLLKGIIDSYNIIINEKGFYDQAIDSDIKRYEEIRKLTTGQGEDYTTGWLLDYDYIKNHYRVIAVDLSRQKELYAKSKAIQQLRFDGQLKNPSNEILANESMFVLTTLEKIKGRRLKFSQGSVTVLEKMANYQEARVKVTITQLNKLKSAAKNKTGTILKIIKKNFEDEELPRELFLTRRQTTKIKNAFVNNMSTDIKLSKAQVSKMIQCGGFLCNILGNLGKKVILDLAIPLARHNLPGLGSNVASNAINKFERKISGKGALREGKVYTLFILNEDMNDLKIIKLVEDLDVLIDGVTETVKYEIKKQEVGFFWALLAPLVNSIMQPVISSVVKDISGRGVRKARRRYMNKNF